MNENHSQRNKKDTLQLTRTSKRATDKRHISSSLLRDNQLVLLLKKSILLELVDCSSGFDRCQVNFYSCTGESSFQLIPIIKISCLFLWLYCCN